MRPGEVQQPEHVPESGAKPSSAVGLPESGLVRCSSTTGLHEALDKQAESIQLDMLLKACCWHDHGSTLLAWAKCNRHLAGMGRVAGRMPLA